MVFGRIATAGPRRRNGSPLRVSPLRNRSHRGPGGPGGGAHPEDARTSPWHNGRECWIPPTICLVRLGLSDPSRPRHLDRSVIGLNRRLIILRELTVTAAGS